MHTPVLATRHSTEIGHWSPFSEMRKPIALQHFSAEPPRGLEPRTYALRDCTHAWIRPKDLLPTNDFRDTKQHTATLSDREKGRRKGRESMRRFGGSSSRT